MKRTPLKRKTRLQRSSPLKAGFTQRLHPQRPLATWCDLRLDGCQGRAVERHERKRRSQGGDGSPENTFDSCRHCHDFVHANVALAYENGWLIRGVSRNALSFPGE